MSEKRVSFTTCWHVDSFFYTYGPGRRFLKADTGQTRMYLKQKELSLQENILSAVCANAVSVVRI